MFAQTQIEGHQHSIDGYTARERERWEQEKAVKAGLPPVDSFTYVLGCEQCHNLMSWLHHGLGYSPKKDCHEVRDIISHLQYKHGLMLEVGAETEVC